MTKYSNPEEFVNYLEKAYMNKRSENMSDIQTEVVMRNIGATLDVVTRTSAILHKDNVEKLSQENVDAANGVISKALAKLKQNVAAIKK